MKKSLIIGITALVIGSAVPIFAADGYYDRLDDRVDRRLDVRGVRINDRLDAKGDRVNDRLDTRGNRVNDRLDVKGDRINDRLDAAAEKARADGKTKLANRLDRRGDR